MFADIEIIPMRDNYDGSTQEPVHFLPLIPVALLNPSEGIAVGFASTILPRKLEDLIQTQLNYLSNSTKKLPLTPHFVPINQSAVSESTTGDKYSYLFQGDYVQKDSSTLIITQLPYGQSYEKVLDKLDAMVESGTIIDVEDKSKNIFNIIVKFKRGSLNTLTRVQILHMLGLSINVTENLNVLDFLGTNVWSARPQELIEQFTTWRLSWYARRYERLRGLLKIDLSRLYDIRIAIKNNIGSRINKIGSRQELKIILDDIKIVNLDYIADLGIYRFTEDERLKNERKIIEAEKQLRDYDDIISSDIRRCDIYSSELKQIQLNQKQGLYC